MIEQGADLGTVVSLFVGQRCCDDLAGVGIQADVQLAPGPARLGTVFLDQPLASPAELLQSVEPRGSPDIAKHGRAAWQKTSGYTKQARAEAAIGRFKQVIGDGLRSRTDRRRATEVDMAIHALNRMLEPGRPISVRIA